MLGSTIPRTRKVFGVIAAAAFSAILGLTVTSGAASGAGSLPPNEDTRVLDVQTNAITTNPELLYVPITPCRIVDTRNTVGADRVRSEPQLLRGWHVRLRPAGRNVRWLRHPDRRPGGRSRGDGGDPDHAGYLRAWPAGTGGAEATLLNYAGDNIGIGGIRSSCAPAPGPT